MPRRPIQLDAVNSGPVGMLHHKKTPLKTKLPNLIKISKNNDALFTRKEFFEEYRKNIDERCALHLTEITTLEKEINDIKEGQKKTQLILISALISIIATFISVIVGLTTGIKI